MRKLVLAGAAVLAISALLHAQDRLKSMPGYAQHERMAREIPTAVKTGALAATWTADSRVLSYMRNGKRYTFDVATRQTIEGAGAGRSAASAGGPHKPGASTAAPDEPERGRQFTTASSPDGTLKALYRDRNVYLVSSDGTEQPITTDGSVSSRVKYGTATWVYGEELEQKTAMWWSPDGRRLAYYR